MKFSLNFFCIIFIFSIPTLAYGQIEGYQYSKSVATANIGAEQKFSLDFGVADICKYSLDIFARGDHYYFAAGECNNAHDFNKNY
ncbi:MAG: hypothetical protein KBF42_11045 [Chitinophagales bacterium]|jgi:hypothetical protein|nr:hypothetical protein [Bacteroidota bacterium]MBP8917226.1 hypothetical protein [Chitinophagales bacterium]MBP9221914.1 hypothetical protein [Chitinophagales bacterium]MBP9796122.1 hypothetical protein [Chitinophagales bacterium]